VKDEDKAARISDEFQRNWDVQLEKRQHGKAPSLIRALFASFGTPFVIAGVFKALQDILTFVSPQLLKYVINFSSPENNEPAWHGYFYASMLFAAAAIQSIFLHQYFHRVMKTGMRLRSALVCAIYRKSLRLSNTARQSTTSGEIVNLMSVDAQVCALFHTHTCTCLSLHTHTHTHTHTHPLPFPTALP
jgi:ATP-binding cassette subfamily C (CFTR/MRP) protein 1